MAIGQAYYKLWGSADGSDPDYKLTNPANLEIGINNEILAQIGRGSFSKIGIQAPVGTKILLNNKEIMIGRSGVYELEDGIEITTMYILKPTKYVRDTDAEDAAIANGMAEMKRALDIINPKLDALDPDASDYTVQYHAIWDKYRTGTDDQGDYDYDAGWNEYQTGKAGIYKANGVKELHNIIIDYIYG